MSADDTTNELAALYVLGALEPDELALVEASLSADGAFRHAVDEARDAIELLPLAVSVKTPPSHLRDALMRQVAQSTAPIASAVTPRAVIVEEPTLLERWQATLTRVLGGWGPALATAGVGLAFVFGFFTVTTRQELTLERDNQARVAPQATAGAMVMSAFTSPRSTSVPMVTPTPRPVGDTLSATQAAPQGRALVDQDAQRLLLVFRHLPPLPQRQIYQAWSAGAGQQPLPLGTVRMGDDGVGVLITPLMDGSDRMRDLMVTIEPDTGSDRPTMPAVLTSSR